MLHHELEDYLHFLQIERGLADNTLTSYKRDLTNYMEFLKKKQQINHWNLVTRNDILQFLYHLKDTGKSTATISRHISSIRSFHQFLVREQIVSHDASVYIEKPKKDRTLPDVLSQEEVDRLLDIQTR